MVEKIVKEAVFGDWKLKSDFLSSSIVPGPFTVRVMPSSNGKSYVAKLMPTEQFFAGITKKTADEACCTVAAMFGKVVSDWQDVK